MAIGFLTAVSAAALIGGLIALLLRRRMARLLIVVGAMVALLIFAGLFVAGAKLSPVVYAIPVLPVASVCWRCCRPPAGGPGPLELRDRRVVVHQLDPPGAAEVDQRHGRLADAGHLLDAAEAVLVVGDPIARLQHQQRTLSGR